MNEIQIINAWYKLSRIKTINLKKHKQAIFTYDILNKKRKGK